MAEEIVRFHNHPQEEALATFLPLLTAYLPSSNNLYNRMRAPHNVPDRHCLFAATFPPSSSQGARSAAPGTYTILFADRSRHSESQIWIFNPIIAEAAVLSSAQQALLTAHVTAAIHFLKDVQIPEAPGWPFSPVLRFACLHEHFSATLKSVAEPKDAFARATYWNLWNISTADIISSTRQRRPLPEGFTVGRVPKEQLDIVLSTSAIVRQPSTMLMLPSVGILNEEGKLIAWGYIGIDGSFATLKLWQGRFCGFGVRW
ncbi:hypothetical protein D0Z07_5371 [Hyphodiscus hymeniophilus]|uniref:Uncharacterized protein n=1 Tax=Hyphodiscus hymeniophilus TaxID=353542 RepID=A0A9P7AWF9_9HELO|nr:hypothetical protein D0Z07_5371 [Hyphodiscus hymeniophilus]